MSLALTDAQIAAAQDAAAYAFVGAISDSVDANAGVASRGHFVGSPAIAWGPGGQSLFRGGFIGSDLPPPVDMEVEPVSRPRTPTRGDPDDAYVGGLTPMRTAHERFQHKRHDARVRRELFGAGANAISTAAQVGTAMALRMAPGALSAGLRKLPPWLAGGLLAGAYYNWDRIGPWLNPRSYFSTSRGPSRSRMVVSSGLAPGGHIRSYNRRMARFSAPRFKRRRGVKYRYGRRGRYKAAGGRPVRRRRYKKKKRRVRPLTARTLLKMINY